MSSRFEYSVEFLYKSGGSEEMVATPRCARNIQTSARYQAVGRTLCKAAVWSQQIQALAKYMFSQMSPLKYFFCNFESNGSFFSSIRRSETSPVYLRLGDRFLTACAPVLALRALESLERSQHRQSGLRYTKPL